MRQVVLLVLFAVLVAGCGSHKLDAYAQANLALLDRMPVYPGAVSPHTTTSGTKETEFGARDWTLPKNATQTVVVKWYERELQKRGWKITGESFGTIRAVRRGAALSVGVRERTLEAVANSRGG
ncbi:MAG: hypothetical protein ACXVRJ_04630 [Gaiellaceae bacterium]